MQPNGAENWNSVALGLQLSDLIHNAEGLRSAGGLPDFAMRMRLHSRHDPVAEAVSWLQKSARANPRFIACQRMLIASLAQSGNVDAARSAAQNLLQTNPDFRVGQLLKWYPLARSEDLHRFEDGLRKAGLP